MREILISTESGSDLPPELIKRHDFHVVPMHVIIEDTDYADGTIPVDMVFEHFERTGKVPSTSAVNVAEYLGATLLSLKPLIEMVDGKLIATKKYHGPMKRWVDKFMDDFTQKYHLRKDCLYLMYGKGLSEEVLKRMAENAKRLGFESYEYVMTGCVISCHGGKGAIGLAGMLE